MEKAQRQSSELRLTDKARRSLIWMACGAFECQWWMNYPPYTQANWAWNSSHWTIRNADKELIAHTANQEAEIWSRNLDGRKATQNSVVPKSQFSISALVLGSALARVIKVVNRIGYLKRD